MSVIPPITEVEQPRRWRWTGDDLVRLAGLGFLPPEQRFELMAGEIVEIMPPSLLHAAIVALFASLLQESFGTDVHVREEKPVRLGPHYDPQPHVAVVRGKPLDYASRFPTPEELLLVVEVADSSLEYDRTDKLAAYAEAGVPLYWIVNLRDRQLEIYSDPSGAGYRRTDVVTPDQTLTVGGSSLELGVLFSVGS